MIYDDLTVRKPSGMGKFGNRYPDPKPLEYDNVIEIDKPGKPSFSDLLEEQGVSYDDIKKIREDRIRKNSR